MTTTEYGALVTQHLDELSGGYYQFPDDFDYLCEQAMNRRMTAKQLAAALLEEPDWSICHES